MAEAAEVITTEDRRRNIELGHYWQDGFGFFREHNCIVSDEPDRVGVDDLKAMFAMVRQEGSERIRAEQSYNRLWQLAEAGLVAQPTRVQGRVRIILLKPL